MQDIENRVTVDAAIDPHQSRWQRAGRWIVDEQAVLVLVAGTFFARWLLADWNSYWLDELYSVYLYVLVHDSLLSALTNLAETSIHPPLYQALLYLWITIFGDSEIATRSLSNLYIAMATLTLYLLAKAAWTRRIAFLSAAAFAVMYTPTYYGLETRSYAQTIFLVTLSSYLLLYLLRVVTRDVLWRSPSAGIILVLLLGANTALLMTHYYNVFWLAGQGIIAVLYLIREWPLSRWQIGAGGLAAIYGVPVGLFWVTWGGVFSRQLRERSEDYGIDGSIPERNVADLLLDQVVTLNLDPPMLVAWIGVAAVTVLFARSIITISTAGQSAADRDRAWTFVYLLGWLVLPLVVVYVAFSTLGVERYSSRYFVYSTVPLAPLIVLTIEKTVRGVERVLRGLPVTTLSSALAAIAIVTLLLPLGHDAATHRKSDWRGIVGQVNDMVQQDEDHEYIIYEASFRRRTTTDYYFDQLPGDIGPYDALQRLEERRGRYRLLDSHDDLVAEHDYLIITFTHVSADSFPNALQRLEDRYDLRHRQLNHQGRGFIVYGIAD